MASLFGFPIHSDSGTFSAGDWTTALPLANMQDDRLAKVARSTDATEASTKFDIDLGSAQVIKLVALCGHNLSLSATVRVYADDEATFTSPPYDSTAVNAYPTIYPADSTLWGVDVSSSAMSAAEYAAGARSDYFLVLSTAQTYRYWRVVISDTGNTDGYVQIGRCAVTAAYAPTARFMQGGGIGHDTESRSLSTDGGARIEVERPRRRRFDVTIPKSTEAEAMVQLWEVQRRIGTAEQFVFVYDDADTIYLQRRAYLATMDSLDLLRVPSAFWMDQPLSIVEVLP